MIVLPDLDRDAVRSGLESLLGLPGGSDDHVRFRRSLFEAQVAALDPSPGAGDGLSADALGRTLAALRDRFLAEGRPPGPLAQLAADAEADPTALARWVEASDVEPGGRTLARLARRLGVAVDVLVFYGAVLAAPARYAAVRSRPTPAEPGANAGRCPCCHSAPGLALVTPPDGQRVLCCGTCAARWSEVRLACPGCGDASALITLRDPDRPRTWVEACTACHGSLVTVDLRQGPTWGHHVLPLVERTASLYLDLLAEKEGYTPLHPYAALL